MTRPLNTGLQGTLHDCGGACAAAAPGHELSLIQDRLARATPSRWQDAVVVATSPAGWIEVALLADDSVTTLWNHGHLSIRTGEPVVLHSVYDVLAVGNTKLSVLRITGL